MFLRLFFLIISCQRLFHLWVQMSWMSDSSLEDVHFFKGVGCHGAVEEDLVTAVFDTASVRDL